MHVLLFLFLGFFAPSAQQLQNNDPLDQGFVSMYNLAFAHAHQLFESWRISHPQDPQGPVFDAAAYLFSEFDRLNILKSEFYVSDQKFATLKRVTASPEVKQKFEQALADSQKLSDARLAEHPNDEGALFANVLRIGLHAEYLALIEKENLAALSEVKQGTDAAQALLKLYPDCYDAYIAEGIENYLLSMKPAPLRWVLHATGAQTDRQTGIQDLRVIATKGHYLQPYAEVLLSIAALRDHNPSEAQHFLSDLAQRFPANPLYREELAKLR